MPRTRDILALCLLMGLLGAAVVWRLMIGGGGDTPEMTSLMLEVRQWRVVSGLVVGAALGVSGVLLQSLLRNPLASPDLLGLASGAGLGVMAIVYIGYLAGLGIAATDLGGSGVGWTTTSAAVLGALGALALVYVLSQRRGLLDPITLVLVGVVVAIMCGAGTQLLKSLMPDQGVAASRLLRGMLSDDVPRGQLALVGGLTLASIVAGAWAGPAMDAAALGDDEARSVGVGLGRLRTLLFVLSGVLAASSVVIAGPVGFVGLICPHAARLLLGPSHRVLVVGAAVSGATLVIGADAATRLIDFGSGHPPISILTSLLGGPVLVLLLRRRPAQ
ncbi:MAG TPA: iron ABC transporter permease [Phycisphaerales bacterium]|nr:iron ABC transporter permease [Phycisphaerales bacterium]